MYSLAVGLILCIDAVYGQVAITFMYGQTNGLTGKGYGTMDGTPRNVSTRNPAMLDNPIIREAEVNNGSASPCGRTLMSGKVDMNVALEKAEDGGLPDVGPDGKIKLVAHQITKDGSGPYTCAVDVTATGTNFVKIQVTVDLPSNNVALAKPTDFSLEAQMPSGMKCKGGADNMSCVVKCVNAAATGPFGGCMAFTQMQGLYNDPSPAGKGPSKHFELDRITENPVTRDANLFEDAKSKMSPKDLQQPPTKGKRSSVLRYRRATTQNSGPSIQKSQNNGANVQNGKDNGNTNNNTNFGPGHVKTIMPTEEGIAYEIATAILGQADVPQNVRQSLTGP